MFGRRRGGDLVVVGLGNPGPRYARTRHNAGAMLVDALADACGASLKRARGQARATDATFEGTSVKLAIPTTFMNESGRPVAKLARKAGELLVCHDELDLPLGRVRLKEGGGTGGHNGLDSVCASLRTKDFLRLRIGIGRPPESVDPIDHVLGTFHPDELDVVSDAIEQGIEALGILVREDLDAAQTWLHSRT